MSHDKIRNRRRLLRLVEVVDSEQRSHGIENDAAARLYNCGDALRDGLTKFAGDPDRANDEEVACVGPEAGELICPPYLASSSEGAGESSFRDNPVFFAGNAAELADFLSSSYEEGWACNWIVSLDSGQHVLWETRCRLLGEQYLRVSADAVEEGDWIVLDRAGEPGNEPRRVKGLHQDSTQIHLTFGDSDPGASFAVGEMLWRQRRDGEEATLVAASDPRR